MEQLVSFIIRPPRADYNPKDDLLDEEFMLKGHWFQRKDLEITNSRGHVLQCSHYMPLVIPEGTKLPCVIYCHGNSGCRADASEAAIILLPSYITVFTLDFAGSGLSGGEHVTLGWYEKDDLTAVVNYLRSEGNVSCIGLWGRSMGAVTSLMYGAEDPSIAGMVLDSPFSDLVELMMELVDTYKYRLPKFTVKFAIQFMRKAIQKKAKFDITELNTIKVAKSCFVPVLIGHGMDDDFIQPHHSERIHDAYVGDKNIIKFEGDHNSPRPQFYFDSITIFFHNVLNPPKVPVNEHSYIDSVHSYYGKGNWDTMHEVGYTEDSFIDVSKDTGSSSTEEAISEVRSKRPMSRMEVPSDSPSKENGHDDLISFELSSNGHPSTIDDDQYVEYPLDNLSGFPCDMEEEERMFMEAVIESLRDLEVRHPQEGEKLSDVPTASLLESAPNDDLRYFTITENHTPSKSDGSSTSGTSTTLDSVSEIPSPHVSVSSSEASLVAESRSKATNAKNASSSSGNKSVQDSDTGGTRATLTVQKNAASNIMDGLRHRWGLNFFKNS
ncbi:hypothetical protein ACHQM5_026970 [Ranunculus cassubicifolius]